MIAAIPGAVASGRSRDALLRARRRPRRFGAGSPTIYRGDGYEFVELRAYVPGDDVRRIDWASTARSGELQSRVVLEDVTLTLAAFADGFALDARRAPPSAARRGAAKRLRTGSPPPPAKTAACALTAAAITPAALQRGSRTRAARLRCRRRFDLRRTLRTALAALPRGTALLAISDWYDLDASYERELAELGARFDCTALIARDPWYDGLPLRAWSVCAEPKAARCAPTSARASAPPTHARCARGSLAPARASTRANWRTGVLREEDGRASLAAAFGLRA